MTPQLGATPLRLPEIPRLLKPVPLLGLPLPPGMMSLLAMAPSLGMPLRLGPMALPKTVALPKIAWRLEAPPLPVVTRTLGLPLRLGMSLPEMAPVQGRALLSGVVSLLQMKSQRVQALHHQGSTSPACRMTPAGW